MRASFFWKLALSSVALILGATLIVALLGERVAREDLLRDLRGSLRARSALLAEIALPALRGEFGADQATRIGALGIASGARLTVLRADGTVVADSHMDPGEMGNHLKRPEIVMALANGEGSSERESGSLGKPYSYFALAVPSKDQPLGFVRCAIPLEEIDTRLRRLRNVILLGGGATSLLAVILALYLTRRFTAPLTAMTESAESIARGEYGHLAQFAGTDEIGRLSQAFETMTTQLEERLSTITNDRNKLLAILASMVEGVIAVNRDERVVHMNQVAGAMLDVVPEQCLGKRIWEVTRVRPVCEILDAALRTQADSAGECSIAGESSPSAATRSLELRASVLRDGDGELAGAVLVLHDVTSLRKLESMRRDFVANVSHELKTPLTAIRGMVETMLDDERMPEDTRTRFLERTREQSSRLSALVVDLLTLARIESNETVVERRALDMRGVVRESLARYRAEAGAKSIHLGAVLPDVPVIVHADEESLRQIIDNLLDNACKYTLAGGRVDARLSCDGGEVLFEVKDTGIGIEVRDQARVFERFYRVDKARSRELGGTGLGLAIVKHLTLTLGGRVSVESSPGRGSTFAVRLPLAGETR